MSESNRQGRNRVVVYPDWCKGCGICVAFCPKKVLGLGPDGKARVENEAACVNCGFCEPHCPDFAILVRPEGGNGRLNGNGPPPPQEPVEQGEQTPDQDNKEGRS